LLRGGGARAGDNRRAEIKERTKGVQREEVSCLVRTNSDSNTSVSKRQKERTSLRSDRSLRIISASCSQLGTEVPPTPALAISLFITRGSLEECTTTKRGQGDLTLF